MGPLMGIATHFGSWNELRGGSLPEIRTLADNCWYVEHGHCHRNFFGVQEKCWINENQMEQWNHHFCATHAARIFGPKILLVIFHPFEPSNQGLITIFEPNCESIQDGQWPSEQNAPVKNGVHCCVKEILTFNDKANQAIKQHRIGFEIGLE